MHQSKRQSVKDVATNAIEYLNRPKMDLRMSMNSHQTQLSLQRALERNKHRFVSTFDKKLQENIKNMQHNVKATLNFNNRSGIAKEESKLSDMSIKVREM